MTEAPATYDAGTPATTPQLDPAAVEAAAKVYWINATGRNDTRGSMAWSEQSDVLQATIRDTITSNITAFIAAIEPQLRERVDSFGEARFNEGISDIAGEGSWHDDLPDPVAEARAAVYALFGLEAE